MTESERIARAQRAKAACDEFLTPMFDTMRAEYSSRMIEVANSELNGAKRADKITALSNALRIVSNLEGGMKAMIEDGEMALASSIRVENIEKMTAPQRRLLGIAPY